MLAALTDLTRAGQGRAGQRPTQQKWPWQREQVMWLQPPFLWMGAPQLEQGLVFFVSQDSLSEAASFLACLSISLHSLNCTMNTSDDPASPHPYGHATSLTSATV